MNGYHSQMIAELRTAIQTGTLTCSEIVRRLTDAIDKELGKTDEEADLGFIEACQNLLGELYGNPIKPTEELMRSSLESAREKLRSKSKRSTKFFQTSLRIAVVAAALIIFAVLGDQVLRREWLDGDSSDDKQQFTVSGHVVDPGLVDSGKAGTSTKEQEVTTAELSEAIAVLGHIPKMPTWFPTGWEIDEYYAHSKKVYQLFNLTLVSEKSEELVKYEATRYSSLEDAQASFEQNEHGQSLSCNGWDVYFTQNTNGHVAVWWEGDTCYALYGPLSQSDLVMIIESIQKGVP